MPHSQPWLESRQAGDHPGMEIAGVHAGRTAASRAGSGGSSPGARWAMLTPRVCIRARRLKLSRTAQRGEDSGLRRGTNALEVTGYQVSERFGSGDKSPGSYCRVARRWRSRSGDTACKGMTRTVPPVSSPGPARWKRIHALPHVQLPAAGPGIPSRSRAWSSGLA